MVKIAAIIGCASCWENDLNQFKSICNDFDVFAIGLDCPYKGDIKYFVTYHVEDIEPYRRKRIDGNLSCNYKVIAHTMISLSTARRETRSRNGSIQMSI